jgi:apolipoprotein N-acyltransferase
VTAPAFKAERWSSFGLSALSGTLLFLSCANFDVWPLAWFAITPLFFCAMDRRLDRPALYGFVCGLVANGGGFYWLVGFLQRFGHLPLIAALPIFGLLIGYQALTFTLFTWGVRRLEDRLKLGLTFLAPTVYVAIELSIPYVFPWYLSITQAWVPPVIQIAEWTGPLGVSFLIVLSNAALYEIFSAVRERRPLPRRRLLAAAAVLVGSIVFGFVRIHSVETARAAAPKLRVGLVQANVGISQKWRPHLADEQLTLHQELARDLESRGAELVVWPESSYPYLFRRDQTHDWPSIDRRQAMRGIHTPLLFGSLTVGDDGRFPYNSALLLDRSGEVRGRFDKNILMVFGEYIPFYDQMKWLHDLIPETSNWARGTDVEVFSLPRSSGEVRVGPMICYEDIFPSFGRRLAKKRPNLLVNITNDAWFGRTSEPYEHLALAVFRSVELRLDLVRAVNTGVSAFVDATGRVARKSISVDPDEKPDGAPPLTLLGEVALLEPSTLYAALGEWFGGCCLAISIVLLVAARARAGSPIRWRLAFLCAAVLTVTIGTGLAFFTGAGGLRLGLHLLTHRPIPAQLAAEAFTIGIRLLFIVAIGALISGGVVRRVARRRVRIESAIGVTMVLILPAACLGSLEGEQAGLVIGGLLAVALSLFGGFLAGSDPGSRK